MAQQLKGVIFGVDNVLVPMGKSEPHLPVIAEVRKLVQFLSKRGVDIVVMTNRTFSVTLKNKTTLPAQAYFEQEWGIKIDWHLCGQNGAAGKQSHEGFQAVLTKKGWESNNAVFIGNSKDDMIAAVNNSMLLLTARWYPDTTKTTDYGFQLAEPKEVARFIDVFCLRSHYWYYHINDGPIQMYALAPLNTFHDVNKYHCDDFLANVKNQYANDEEFWARFLCTSMYFSGVYKGVKFITAYPKCERGKHQTILVKPMDTFAKCFQKRRFVPDLIQRHTTALKSQFNRPTCSHERQIKTIRLNPTPTKLVKGEAQQMPFPVKTDETVLVIDDVCTEGFSFEAARAFLEAAGAKVISVSFLKTPKNDYKSIADAVLSNGPFQPNPDATGAVGKVYPYHSHIVDKDAPVDLTARLKRYQNWDWPT